MTLESARTAIAESESVALAKLDARDTALYKTRTLAQVERRNPSIDRLV
jgi:hypothetical protein